MSTTVNVGPAHESSPRAEQIRGIAADLFEMNGYAATTVQDIADAAGVLPGSLYHHFESKEVIAVGLLEDVDRDIVTLTSDASRYLVRTTDPREAIERFATDVVRLSLRHSAALRLYTYDAPTAATDRLRKALKLKTSLLERLWKIAVERLVPDPTALQDTGLLRFTLHQSTLHPVMHETHARDASAIARELCATLFDGLLRHCPEDAELDASEPLRVAREQIARWSQPVLDRAPDPDRDEVIAAARREFARRGYDATTIRDIANAAGIRMGTLYRRVESKEAILTEIITEYDARIDGASRTVMSSSGSEAEAVDGLIAVFVHARRRFRDEIDTFMFGWAGREEPSSPLHDYYLHTQSRLRMLEEIIRRGLENGSMTSASAPVEIAPHIRALLWLPYQDFARTSTARAQRFLRDSMLRGFLQV